MKLDKGQMAMEATAMYMKLDKGQMAMEATAMCSAKRQTGSTQLIKRHLLCTVMPPDVYFWYKVMFC